MKRGLDPEEILLDASNLPSFNRQQFEGQIERPIKRGAFYIWSLGFLLVGLIFIGRVFQLQIIDGAALAARSESNTLRQIPIFAERGLVNDRFGTALAWNDNGRHYLTEPGFANLLGYVSRPAEETIGQDGVEKIYNDRLRGQAGIKIEEVDVNGHNTSDYLLQPPTAGENLTLAIDARLQEAFQRAISGLVAEGRFVAGAGVMLDTTTGEIMALTNVPEYDSNILAAGADREKIKALLNDSKHPFLNRAVAGLYTPGSIIKPIMATAALTEKIIDPLKQILSTGELVVPNPYFPDQPSVFKDWKALGWLDLRHAIAMSSDVYFYTIGGGVPGQAGLGIANIDKYAHLFGLGEPPGSPFTTEEAGTIPTPEWKKANFKGADWLLGDTYHTVIGQYGFQVTPLQIVRAIAAVANDGHLVTPTLLASAVGETTPWQTIPGLDPKDLQIVREGMRLSATMGTGSALNVPGVTIGTKTGTAELGTAKEQVNSWVAGFFPYEHPRYAFTIVMERGARTNLIGAPYAMRQVLDWMIANTPEYFKG